MERDSVRALKAELAETVLRPLIEESHGLATFGVAARSLRRMTGVRPGVALGITRGKGKRDYQLAVRVQLRTLESLGDLQQRLSERAQGEIDYRYVGRISKRQAPWHQTRQRPLLIGCSVGHFAITAGTLGAFAQRRKSQRAVILSNNHVLANEDNGRVGDAILQPGHFDGGRRPADRVGDLLDCVKLKTQSNLVDAAIASIGADFEFDPRTLTGLGTLNGVRPEPLEPGDRVAKVGRTTGVTHGTVTAVELDDVVVRYDRGDLSFDNQIEIEGAGELPFSEGGDSGSVIVDRGGLASALLFAGGDTGGSNGMGLTYANDIQAVLQQLNLELAV